MENGGKDRKGKPAVRTALVALAIGILLAGGAGFFLNLYEFDKTVRKYADPDDPDLVTLGRKVYDENCASCHGAELQGEADWRRRKADGTLPAPPHDETGHTWHHPDSLLFRIVKSGGQAVMPEGFVSGMPGYGDVLTDREILASLAYIKSRWPAEVRRRQARFAQQSQ